ncbi:MAG: sigma-70 family RNA polymerase sigma factor [Bifidobacteriaceae bacterium]|jgi:RNA polymerase sigma-70 factor (ECF subfamily)|nr:sigma-70 family RNA polymerase sigma factor [Bifidobacteriaceae bacterium]
MDSTAVRLDYQPDLPADTHSVVQRYEAMVYGIALTHTQCRGDADDVFQDVFLAYHRTMPAVASEEHRKAWLIVTTLNCAKKVALGSWRTRVVPLTPGQEDAAAPEVFHFATEEQDAVFRAMSRLPEAYRTVLHLFYFEDLPVGRIAELLNLDPGAVRVRLSRGRQQMKDQLLGALFDE